MIESELKKLESVGLNLISICKVMHLPSEIRSFSHSEDDTLILIGHGGKELWNHLPHPLNPELHSIDTFAVQHAMDFAKNCGMNDVRILYPSDSHDFSLQKTGRAMNLARAGSFEIDLNHKYGLWFAYRVALLTSSPLSERIPEAFTSACESCLKKNCLQFSEINERRKACPVATEHAYTEEQIDYHQRSAGLLVRR